MQFVTASLGNVVMEKKKSQKCVPISPENARSKPTVIVLCSTVQHGLCLNVSFISGERLLKSSIIQFVTVVLFLLKYEYCVLYCRNPENKVAKQAIIYRYVNYRYVYFHVLYLFLRDGLCLLQYPLLFV